MHDYATAMLGMPIARMASCSSLYSARRSDGDLLLRPTGIGTDGLDLLDDVHALNYLAKDDVLAVKP